MMATAASFIDRDIMNQKQLIFILGMGRSGTSALARVLSLCGCVLPAALKDPNVANPRGFWEPVDALKLNDEFLFRHQANFFDPTLRLQGELTFTPHETERYVARIGGFLRHCPQADAPLVIKDPRITGLFDFWLAAARLAGFSVRVIVAIRNPSEVVASLSALIEAPVELWQSSWLKYNLLAELHSRQLPRVFVEYASLLDDWRGQVARITRELALGGMIWEGAAEIDAFLTRELHTKRCQGAIAEPFGYPWLSDTYSILTQGANDQPLDVAKLDEILRVYRACERAFRTSLDASRSTLPRRLPQDGIMTWIQET